MITDTVVVLFFTALPLIGSAYGSGGYASLDRVLIADRAGCPSGTALISLSEDPGRGWTVVVRCRRPVVPTAEILRRAN